MVLVAHPQGYPQTMHIYCGHQERGCQCPAALSSVPSRSFMRMTVKDLSERDVSVPMFTCVPWSKQMSAHYTKTRPALCRYSWVIHNLSSSQGDWASCSIRPDTDVQSSISRPCRKRWKDDMMPAPCCFLLSQTRSLAAYMVGECIDAETCDGVATGED